MRELILIVDTWMHMYTILNRTENSDTLIVTTLYYVQRFFVRSFKLKFIFSDLHEIVKEIK